MRAGLQREQPVLWVLEGLLYYLEPGCVPGMLRVGEWVPLSLILILLLLPLLPGAGMRARHAEGGCL